MINDEIDNTTEFFIEIFKKYKIMVRHKEIIKFSLHISYHYCIIFRDIKSPENFATCERIS